MASSRLSTLVRRTSRAGSSVWSASEPAATRHVSPRAWPAARPRLRQRARRQTSQGGAGAFHSANPSCLCDKSALPQAGGAQGQPSIRSGRPGGSIVWLLAGGAHPSCLTLTVIHSVLPTPTHLLTSKSAALAPPSRAFTTTTRRPSHSQSPSHNLEPPVPTSALPHTKHRWSWLSNPQ